MSISYPIALPDPAGFRSITLRAVEIAGMTRSIFSGARQVQSSVSGEYWEADVVIKPMKRAAGEAYVAWMLSLKGPVGSFYLGDPAGKTPRGTISGSPTVNGASQTGSSLVIAGGAGTLLPGDYIQIGSGATQRLYKNLTTATLGSGNSLDIWPKLRESPSNGAAVVYTNCKGVFALGDAFKPAWSIDFALLYGISFSATEAI